MKGESTTLITDKEKETLDKTSSHDNNNNIDKMITSLIQVSTLIIDHLLIEMNKTLLLKFHLLEKP